MRIQKVHVKNFRSILDATLCCDSLTALVGRNGSGKSSFLTALEIFYTNSAKVTAEDFYCEDTSQDIEIGVTFTDFNNEEHSLFSDYINDHSITVIRVLSFSQSPETRVSSTYYGIRLQNSEFCCIKNTDKEVVKKYDKIRNKKEYSSSLPPVSSATKVREALTQWERDHPEHCSYIRDNGKFFGFTKQARGNLGQYTRFIHVPAVRDAQDDATEKRGSCVTEIMDLTVRHVLSTRKELVDFKQQTQSKYKEILDPERFSELQDLQNDLSATLQSYAPNASVLLKWSVEIPMPQTEVKLLEDGYESAVQRTGHGLQRAFILTMLQHLVAQETKSMKEDANLAESTSSYFENSHSPSLVLAIEEPELYQHPSRQRHLASVLLKLASGIISGVAQHTQVIYTTHSPLFVDLDRFDQIRVLRKILHKNGKSKITKLMKGNIDDVASELEKAQEQPQTSFTAETLRPRLQAIMTPWMNEGFFADVVVLVEGESDRAVILGTANAMNYDFDRLGIAIIPCSGKNNLDRPLVIFRQLDIPVYLIWDGDWEDRDAKPQDNKYLLRLLSATQQKWPSCVKSTYSCFKKNMETTLSHELETSFFEHLLLKAQTELGIGNKKQAMKNPAIIQHIIRNAADEGKISASLQRIINNIIALVDREKHDPASPQPLAEVDFPL